jgi:hypothetical protein
MDAYIINPDHSFAVGVVARHHAANVDRHHFSSSAGVESHPT